MLFSNSGPSLKPMRNQFIYIFESEIESFHYLFLYFCDLLFFWQVEYGNGTCLWGWAKDIFGMESAEVHNQCKLGCGGKCYNKCKTYRLQTACLITCVETTPPASAAPPGEDCLSTPRSGKSSNVDIKRTKRVQKKAKARALRKGQQGQQ